MGDNSDVYVFQSVASDNYICCACRIKGDYTDTVTATPAEMVTHLYDHRKAGHKVPDYPIKRLLGRVASGAAGLQA